MTEFFIIANSFAAPFFSDTNEGYVEAESAENALRKFVDGYKHPAGLYAAGAYPSADAMKKGQPALAKWLCNHEIEKMRLTAVAGCYTYYGNAPGDFTIDNVRHTVDNPKEGRIVLPDAITGQWSK